MRAAPGDLLLLPGYGFSATDTVVYQQVTDTTQPLVARTQVPSEIGPGSGKCPQ